MFVLLYLVAYIDKTNIGKSTPSTRAFQFSHSAGNAKIEGLLPSLHMSGIQYNIALSIFFIPYVLAGTKPPWANSKHILTGLKRYRVT